MRQKKPKTMAFKPFNNGKYMFAPKQLVMIDLHNGGCLFPGIIQNIKFDERTGSATPQADIDMYAWWEDGTGSGSLVIELTPHRYCVDMTDPETIKRFRVLENAEELFYRDENNKLIFPFGKDVGILKEEID
ncbi:MAG: hypothetical protein KAT14_04680 [Candidatus Marinimicrobia bacterium]|nr:hypothetical protein [Candidatus Neomarinimicrobiota bacterium]